METCETPAVRLAGTWIYGVNRRRVAKIMDVALNDPALTIAYAIVTFGGWWGIPREYRAVPWDLIKCDDEGELVTHLTRNELKLAPAIAKPDLAVWSDQGSRAALYAYYSAYGAQPFWRQTQSNDDDHHHQECLSHRWMFRHPPT